MEQLMRQKYLIFVIDARVNSGTKEEAIAIDAFNDELRANGHWIFAAGLSAPSDASLIDNRNDAGLEQSGALFSGVENYSGFWLIQTADEATARSLAHAGSKACNRKVELRPFLGN